MDYLITIEAIYSEAVAEMIGSIIALVVLVIISRYSK